LATIASPGRSPLEIAMSASGARTLEDSTKQTEPPSVRARPTSRPIRTAPRKTDSKAAVHWASVIVATGPFGGPPTLTSAPSSRPHRSWAAEISRAAVVGSALSPTTISTASPSASRAAESASSERPESTTRAPSATRTSAVARPRPRAPPVTT